LRPLFPFVLKVHLYQQSSTDKSTIGFLDHMQRKTLDEDKYIECLEKIIQRDFYPDLPKLRLQMEWQTAVANDDLPKMREIQQRFINKKRKASDSVEPQTPNFEETPLPIDTPTKKPRTAGETEEENKDEPPLEERNLDSFLKKFTSEDNASFSTIMKNSSEKRKQQLWWMNEKTEQQKLIESSSERGALSWPYDPKTQLLTYPTMIPEKAVLSGERVIEASSTRFKKPLPQTPKKSPTPKKNEEKTFEMLTDQEYTLGARRRAEANKKVDLDDLLVPGTGSDVSQSPKVNGFGFVVDPSSTPTRHDPIITWGEIEGTPHLLEPTETPINIASGDDGPGFKLPQTPKRDQIGLDLVDKVKARQRQSLPKTPRSDVLTPRSEAGQRLAEKLTRRTQKGLDLQLRASYNSPLIRSSTSSGPHTPTTSKSKSTPKGIRTPGTTPLHKRESLTPKIASLTDNLLNL